MHQYLAFDLYLLKKSFPTKYLRYILSQVSEMKTLKQNHFWNAREKWLYIKVYLLRYI